MARKEQTSETVVRLYLLGRFEVHIGGRRVVDRLWNRRKPKALLKLLALQPGRSLHREQVVDILWPDLGPAAGARNLSKNLHYVRTLLAERGVTSPPLGMSGEMVVLAPEVWVDSEEFRSKAGEARQLRSNAELYEEVLALYAGELLPEDLYEDWTEPHREELRRLRSQLLLELSQVREVRGQFELAIDHLTELLGAEPLAEQAHRFLMRLYGQAGSREQALQQYQTCREVLKRELAVEPSDETEALYREIVEGRLTVPARPTGAVLGDFVGREREMGELRGALENALAGRGRFVMLTGEPGIGKTRTAEELAVYARLRNARVLWGRCYEGEGAPAFWPWVQVLRSYVSDQDRQRLLSEMGPGASAIAQLLPELGEELPGLREPPELEPEQARFRLFDSITRFFENAARRQPLLLILDDLHWADEPSLLLVRFLAAELRDARLLFIAAYRDTDIERAHPLAQTLDGLASKEGSQRMRLRGLTESDVKRFIELTTEVEPSKALVTAVSDKTEGNPFFVKEVVRVLVSEEGLSLDQAPSWAVTIPTEGVRGLVTHRLDGLTDECRAALEIASVVGRDFEFSVLERVSGPPSDRLLAALEEALNAGLVVELPQVVGRYRFHHALVGETLYAELGITQRVRLHREIGEAIERLHGANEESCPSELAHHFVQAAPSGDVDKAVAYAKGAGDRALAVLAHEEGARLYQLALQVLDLKESDETERGELLLALGEAQARIPDPEAAKHSLSQAIELAEQRGQPEVLARAALAFADEGLGTFGSLVPAVPLERALDRLTQDQPLRALVQARLSMVRTLYAAYGGRGVDERAVALASEARALGRRLGDSQVQARALVAFCWAIPLGQPDERVELGREAVQLAVDARDGTAELYARLWYATQLLTVADIDAVDREIGEMVRLRDRSGSWMAAGLLPGLQAMRAIMRGGYIEAENLFGEALALAQKARYQGLIQFLPAMMYGIRWGQGRLAELEVPVRQAVDQAPEFLAWRAALALLYTEVNKLEEAQETLDRLASNAFKDIPTDATWAVTLALAAEVCMVLGDRPKAAVVYDLLAPFGPHIVVLSYGMLSLGSASRHLGMLATMLGRWDEAERHYESALEVNTRIGDRPWLAHAQHDYGRMLLARGGPSDSRKARELLARSRHAAEELGMQSLLGKVLTLQR